MIHARRPVQSEVGKCCQCECVIKVLFLWSKVLEREKTSVTSVHTHMHTYENSKRTGEGDQTRGKTRQTNTNRGVPYICIMFMYCTFYSSFPPHTCSRAHSSAYVFFCRGLPRFTPVFFNTAYATHKYSRECAGIDWHLENNEGIAQANTLHICSCWCWFIITSELYKEYKEESHLLYME